MGIEPTAQAWEAWVLPLYDARTGYRFLSQPILVAFRKIRQPLPIEGYKCPDAPVRRRRAPGRPPAASGTVIVRGGRRGQHRIDERAVGEHAPRALVAVEVHDVAVLFYVYPARCSALPQRLESIA